MVQGFYTLQEAAQFLTMNVDELKQMAQKREIRSFQDRGTLRFRTQDIHELARLRGGTSDPDVVLGDASLPPAPKSGATPSSRTRKAGAAASAPKTPSKQEGVPEVFGFDFEGETVDLSGDLLGPSSGTKSKLGSGGKPKSVLKTGSGSKKSAASSAADGSDSDVRLVSDGSDVAFSVPEGGDIKLVDSDVRVSPEANKPKTILPPPAPTSGAKRQSQLALGSGTQSKSKLGKSSVSKLGAPRPASAPQPLDSGVRLVPLDDDSNVKLTGGSDEVSLGMGGKPSAADSNVRLSRVKLPPAESPEGNLLQTEEINLDEEIRQHQEKDKAKSKLASKLKAKSQLKLPTTSPFELSDSDLELPSELKSKASKLSKLSKLSRLSKVSQMEKPDEDSSNFELDAPPKHETDFDLVPGADGSVLLEGDNNDFSLEVSDDSDQVVHKGDSARLTSSGSGISLNNPVDAGISLEGAGDEDAGDFDLSLEAEDTPRPQESHPADDSDSEFELKVEKTPKPAKSKPVDDSDSEFELSLDGDDKPAAQASTEDSEFELTLDDSGAVAAIEEEAKPQVKSKKKSKVASDEQDIFDTDFEVPALDESDDAAVADSELESSDFDLALDDSDLAAEDESGSQVVALDEETATTDSDDSAVVDDIAVEDESSDFSALDEDVQVDDEEAVDVDADEEPAARGQRVTVVKEKILPPAPWGVMPVIFMLPCVIIMFLVGILGYELVQTSAGLKPPGPLTQAIAGMIDTPISLKK